MDPASGDDVPGAGQDNDYYDIAEPAEHIQDEDDSVAEQSAEDLTGVLPADHPAMRRVQDALRAQQQKQYDALEEQMRDLKAALGSLNKKRETLGVDLYARQQLLAKGQVDLEAKYDAHVKAQQARLQAEEDLKNRTSEYQKVQVDKSTLDKKRCVRLFGDRGQRAVLQLRCIVLGSLAWLASTGSRCRLNWTSCV